MSRTTITRHFSAPRAVVYRALLDPRAVAQWRVPEGMSSEVHEFDVREGGYFRVSLTYDTPSGLGKSSSETDTYHGYFLQLVPDERIVERIEFETSDRALQGEMTITTTLTDVAGGTELVGVHEGLPPGLSADDNKAGWVSSLDRLAALLQVRPPTPDARLVPVFASADPGLIAIAKSLLDGEGIDHFVKGEGLQDLFGAGRLAGFNPITGPAEFWVREEDARAARGRLNELREGDGNAASSQDE